MALSKDTILIIDEYIHRDLYRDVMIQLKWCTADINVANLVFIYYKIVKCNDCKCAWTYINMGQYQCRACRLI